MLGGVCGGGEEQSRAELAAAETRVTQDMIDVSADRLEGLRTQCATSAELTQQEIRTLEGKLMKLFSRQLVAKSLFDEKLKHEFRNVPRLAQWLRVVGLSPESVQAVCGKVGSMEALKEVSERELRVLLSSAREEEVRRLCRAMFILKKYTDALLREEYAAGDGPSMQLYWDSWDRHHLRGGSPRARARHQRASVPGEDALAAAPPPGGGSGKFPPTPSSARRERNNLAAQEPQPLTKSRSHESQLSAGGPATPLRHDADHCDSGPPSAATGGGAGVGAGPGGAESPPPSPARDPAPPPPPPDDSTPHHRPTVSNNSSVCGSLSVPRSPRTPVARGMAHDIAHRFTKTFNMIATCDLCDKQMLFGAGLKCKECKFKCHRECESKVPPSCGLPPEFVVVFKEQLQNHGSGYPSLSSHSPVAARGGGGGGSGGSPAHSLFSSLTQHRTRKRHRHQGAAPAFPGGPDSSSASSCNSSSPSSPALSAPAPDAAAAAPATPRTPHLHQHAKQQFHFPEVKSSVFGNGEAGAAMFPARHPPHTPLERNDELAASVRSAESSRPESLSGSASTDSARADSLEEGGAAANAADARWPRQNSLSMKEWDIPYDELRLFDVLGTGRFGTVYRGSWHGAVAVKVLNVQDLHDADGALDHFKREVATFRKTRHENLVLFMGACMKPPKLAIVTSLCKGVTLYQHFNLHKSKFSANKCLLIAQQIAQGMGYLHARGIIHKDLKSKNIFVDNNKVVITDFGLFSVTKLCFGNNARGDSLGIPSGWLCYLAPELVRALRAHASVHLPFSKASDVYAFGTVWYEVMCGEWPFKGQAPEAVIWQVGKGIKQSLSTLQTSQEIKDMLMLCWSYRASERPDFAQLLSMLEKLPRKKLERSPSHPVHLSRSAESVF